MNFELVTTIPLDLVAQLQWLWYSAQSSSFIVGDERIAFAIPDSNPNGVVPLESARPSEAVFPIRHPCNLPIPESLYEEFCTCGWHGFQFLPSDAYDHAKDEAGFPIGDLLRTIVIGPDYGHYVLHPSSGLVISLRSGSLELLRQSTEGFVQIDSTRTRCRSAMAFAAHPTEPLIAYGDNAGNFHAHRFSAEGFGKANKLAAKERKAGALDFIDDGQTLIIGGMGYLAAYSFEGDKFSPRHEVPGSVRDFQWSPEQRILFVNQGLNGIACYRYDETGFRKAGGFKPDIAVGQIAVTNALDSLALTGQHTTSLQIYTISGLERLKSTKGL